MGCGSFLLFSGYAGSVQFYQPPIDISKHKYTNMGRRRSIKSSKRLICVYTSVGAGVTRSPGMQSARVFELAPLGRKRLMKSGRECGLKNKHDGKIMARGISSGIDAIVGGKLLVLTFSVVAIGSPLAYVEKRGVPISTFSSLSPLRPCVRSDERERRG